MNRNIFGRNLKLYRKKLGLTQSELGKMSGIGQVNIANYERGIRFPGEETLIILAKTMGITLDLLFSEMKQISNQISRISFSMDDLLEMLLYDTLDNSLGYILGWKKYEDYTLKDTFIKIIIPLLYETGAKWQGGTLSVLQEHLISERIRELITLISINDRRETPSANKVWIGLCGPSEKHDLGVFMISQLLRNRGWHTYFLGPDVPVNDLIEMSKKYKPDLINMTIVTDLYRNSTEAYLNNLDGKISCPIVISGRGFDRDSASRYRMIRYITTLDDGYEFAVNIEKGELQ